MVSSKIIPLELSPLLALHILIGVFNHIWKNIESVSEKHKRTLHQFALSQNCVKETYWIKTFEGNECANFIKKTLDLSNVGIKPQIDAIDIFDDLRNKVFGVELHKDWDDITYDKIPNISKLLKMHILACHVK